MAFILDINNTIEAFVCSLNRPVMGKNKTVDLSQGAFSNLKIFKKWQFFYQNNFTCSRASGFEQLTFQISSFLQQLTLPVNAYDGVDGGLGKDHVRVLLEVEDGHARVVGRVVLVVGDVCRQRRRRR